MSSYSLSLRALRVPSLLRLFLAGFSSQHIIASLIFPSQLYRVISSHRPAPPLRPHLHQRGSSHQHNTHPLTCASDILGSHPKYFWAICTPDHSVTADSAQSCPSWPPHLSEEKSPRHRPLLTRAPTRILESRATPAHRPSIPNPAARSLRSTDQKPNGTSIAAKNAKLRCYTPGSGTSEREPRLPSSSKTLE